jgi:hypothetical protein
MLVFMVIIMNKSGQHQHFPSLSDQVTKINTNILVNKKLSKR